MRGPSAAIHPCSIKKTKQLKQKQFRTKGKGGK